MAQVTMNVACDTQTDVRYPITGGIDELYALVAFSNSNGQKGSFRLPSDHGHRNISDDHSDSNHLISGIKLASLPIKQGEFVDVLVSLFDEDDGFQWAKYLSGALAELDKKDQGRPWTSIGAVITGILGGLQNKDDKIGVFGVRIINQGGNLITHWSAVADVISRIDDIHGLNTHEFRMNGSNSNYVAWIPVK